MMFLIFSCNLHRVAACTLWFFWMVFLSVCVCVCLRPLMLIQACFNLISSEAGGLFTQYRAWKPLGTNWRNQKRNKPTLPISPSLVMAGADLKKRSASNLWPNQLEAGTADGIETGRSIHGETTVFDGDFVWFIWENERKKKKVDIGRPLGWHLNLFANYLKSTYHIDVLPRQIHVFGPGTGHLHYRHGCMPSKMAETHWLREKTIQIHKMHILYCHPPLMYLYRMSLWSFMECSFGYHSINADLWPIDRTGWNKQVHEPSLLIL